MTSLAEGFALSPHAALKQRRDGDILVLPEQAIRLGGSGGEILRLIEGGSTWEALLEALCARYPDSPEIEAEARRFLDEMIEMGGVVAQPFPSGSN